MKDHPDTYVDFNHVNFTPDSLASVAPDEDLAIYGKHHGYLKFISFEGFIFNGGAGELAYEIHVPLNQIYSAYRSLRAAGDPLGMRLFGSRAVESMRLEKGFLHWKSDLITEFDPFETGLDRFVKMDKGNFVGREALASRPAQHRTLVTLAIETSRAPAHPGASVQESLCL